jgi:2-dehydro-3-deoxyphosphogluconate aldolase/(4S)-4-hydroxy-2-oxoglutarate aldolase
MLKKHDVLTQLRHTSAVAVLRTDSSDDVVAFSKALVAGGIQFIEITMTTPGALHAIEQASEELRGSEAFIGAGSVLDAATARAAILAGASFVVGPIFDLETVRLCNSYGVAVIPGAQTPTEIFNAWKAGADVVKVFPCHIGGPRYLESLKGPLPQIELLPTDGVDFETAAAYIKAGAIAVGAGRSLLTKALIAEKDFGKITGQAERFSKLVRDAKKGR